MKLPIIAYVCLATTLLAVLVSESHGQNPVTALDLPGDAYVADSSFARKLNPSGLPTGAQSRTFEAWVYLPSNYIPNTGIFSTWDAAYINSTAFGIKIQSGQRLYLWTHNNDRTSTGSVPVDQWVHIAVIYNSTNSSYAFLINGQDAGSGSIGSLNTRISEVSIGNGYDSNNFKGMIREARFWNRALTAGEIQQRTNGLVVVSEQVGLAGYWPMSEGAGTTAFDQTTNANHLTLTGTAGWYGIGALPTALNWSLVKTGSYYNVIGTTNGSLILPGVAGVFRSTNGGTNWTDVGFPSQGRAGVSVGFPGGVAANNLVFVNTIDDGIFLSTDDGVTWTGTGPVRNSFGTGSAATAFNGVSVVAGYGGWPRGMYKWNGTSWTKTASGSDGNCVIAVSNGWFFAEFNDNGSGGGIYVSRNNGDTWSQAFPQAGKLCDLGGSILAVMNGGQVFSSTNLGTNWTQISTVSQGGVYNLARLNPTSAIFTDSGKKTWRTRDSGQTWSQVWTNGGFFSVLGNTVWAATETGLYKIGMAEIVGLSPAITSQPTNVTASAGVTATFSVTATGTAPLSYQWRFNGTPIAGATNATYALVNVQTNQAGSYAVIVTNMVGSVTSSVAVLTVNAPTWTVIRTNPAVKLVVDANGIYYLAQPLGVVKSTNQGQTWSTTSYNPPSRDGFNAIGGGAATPYGIFIGSLDQGIWRSTDAGATWGNTFGTGFGTAARRMIYSSGTLLTTYGGFLRGIYKWNTSSQSWVQKITNGADFNDFTVDDSGAIYTTLTAGGSGAGGVYKSTDGGETWSNVYSTSYPNNPSVIEWWNGKLVAIRNNLGVVVSSDRGATWQSYSAVAGISGSVDSAADMAVGLDGLLYASFYGYGVKRTADPALGWTDYSQGLPTQLCRDFTVAEGALFVATDAGLARLGFSVPAAPVITIQPTNVTASVGGSANFSVTATGTAPLSYQWRFNGTPIAGATNATYALVNVQTNQAGSYAVIVTNMVGSVTSSVAVLTVNQGQVQINLTNGLVAYYPFNGNAVDESGNGHHGVMTGGAIVADRFGNPGRALNLNGQGDFVTVPHSEILNLTNDLTLTAWVRIQDFPLFRQAYTLFAKRAPAGGFNEVPYIFSINFQYGIPTDYNQLMFVTAHGAGTYQYLGSAPGMVASNTWVHLVAMVETNRLKLFLGGSLVAEQPVTPGSRFGNLAPLLIGSGARTDIPAEFFKGQLDDLRIYNRALSSNEIFQLYANESVPNSQAPDPAGSAPVATVSVFAGSGVAGNVSGSDLLSIQLKEPNGLGFLSTGVLIVADAGNHQLRLIYPPSLAPFGAVPYAASGAAGFADAVDNTQAQMNLPLGLFVGPGNDVFVADTMNNRIRRVSPNGTRTVSTVAGSGGIGLADGSGAAATFNFPNDLVMDSNGNLFVTEFNNHVIRKITPGGAVSIFAGGGVAGSADGQGTAARFNGPGGIARGPDDTLYVTDYLGNRIRKVTPGGVVTTIAGDGVAELRDGVGTAARFNNPDGIALDSRGYLYVTDSHTHSIRRISPRGRVETIAGDGIIGTATGAGSSARFNYPGGITIGPDGRLYVADTYNHRICAIQLDFSAPQVVTQPVGTNLALGGSVSLTVVSSGTSDLTYQWRKGGAVIAGATNPGYALAGVQLSDAAAYDVVVTNAFGSVTSQVAVVTVDQGQVQGNLTNGLVAYYPFNGNANDESGNGNNGVPTTPTLTVDRFGSINRAYNFKNNVNSRIEVAHSASLDVNSSFSVSVWVKFNEPWSFHNEDIIWKSDGSFPSYTGWDLSVNQDNGAYVGHFDLLNPSQKIQLGWPIDFNAQWQSRWQNIVAVRSGPTNSVYINGVLVTAAYNGGLSVSSQSSLIIGGSIHPVSEAYNRDIDDVRIYNRALSTNEIAQLYAAESVPPAGTAPTISTQPTNVTVNVAGSVTFNVTATGTGPLRYQWTKGGVIYGSETNATLALNNVQTNQAGNYTVVITNAYGSVTSSVAVLTVNRLGQTITFGAVGDKTFGAASFTIGATASSGLSPAFSIVSGPATLSGSTVTLTGAGTVVVRASQAGDATYSAALPVDRSFTVAKGNQTINFAALASKVSTDAPFTVSATASSGLAVGFSIVSGPATISGNTITLSGQVGTVVVRAAQTGNANYNAATNVDQSFTVSGTGSFALRQLPAAYHAGTKFTVNIMATPATSVTVYAVEDVVPAGWTVGVINNTGSFDAQNRKVKWGPFFDATARTLTYELTPPANATGVQTFAGVASANGVDTVIGGTTTLDRATRIPADNNPADDRITISEVTAYGTAWKTGATWPIDPNPIPISYVTRAGALWKGGETYRFDATVASAPLWWVNTGGAVPTGREPMSMVAGGRVAAAAVVPGEAAAELAGGFQLNRDFAMTLRVRPGGGVQAYAVEETVPPGWTVKAGSLDQGGTYDSTSRKVKWGPFFDTQARVFTVVLEPGSNTAPVVFAGVASFDGVDVPFSGRRAALRGSFLPENVNAGRNVWTEGFRVVVQGEAGKRYDIHATETPAIPGSWVAVATNLDGAGVVEFTDLLATGRTARFYRVIER